MGCDKQREMLREGRIQMRKVRERKRGNVSGKERAERSGDKNVSLF